MIKWIYNLDDFDDDIFTEDMLYTIASHEHTESFIWILYIKPELNIRYDDDKIFKIVCDNNNLSILNYLLKIMGDIYDFRWEQTNIIPII